MSETAQTLKYWDRALTPTLWTLSVKCFGAFWLPGPGLPNQMDSSLKVVGTAPPPALSHQVE